MIKYENPTCPYCLREIDGVDGYYLRSITGSDWKLIACPRCNYRFAIREVVNRCYNIRETELTKGGRNDAS